MTGDLDVVRKFCSFVLECGSYARTLNKALDGYVELIQNEGFLSERQNRTPTHYAGPWLGTQWVRRGSHFAPQWHAAYMAWTGQQVSTVLSNRDKEIYYQTNLRSRQRWRCSPRGCQERGRGLCYPVYKTIMHGSRTFRCAWKPQEGSYECSITLYWSVWSSANPWQVILKSSSCIAAGPTTAMPC